MPYVRFMPAIDGLLRFFAGNVFSNIKGDNMSDYVENKVDHYRSIEIEELKKIHEGYFKNRESPGECKLHLIALYKLVVGERNC